ncbi:hypothetical protein TL08_15465 [Actinoalloteichus hymeniacidonis]|uniref:Uncharacterized protein n=1 Tax=Actinoalloteichus hymeniacidonis TaxID=340345 RepID=A0AAC9MZB6_9PSEU|nr:hypothetical protein TL08_15465 [Actinoalloteichus hymeniacidonis]
MMIYHDAAFSVRIPATRVEAADRTQALTLTIDRVRRRVLLQLGGQTARGLAALEPHQAELLRLVLVADRPISRLFPALGPGLTMRILWVRTAPDLVELSLSGRGALTDAWRLRPEHTRLLADSLNRGTWLLAGLAEAPCR